MSGKDLTAVAGDVTAVADKPLVPAAASAATGDMGRWKKVLVYENTVAISGGFSN